jgi:hypothetical protein
LVVWQTGQIVSIWSYRVSCVCILMSILYRQSVMVLLFVFSMFVLQCLHRVGLSFIVLSGLCVIFSLCPLCPGCAPGFLPVFWRVGLGFFQRSVEGGFELFWLFGLIGLQVQLFLSGNGHVSLEIGLLFLLC